jgi:putative solute:sodium symporter small subunit
MSKILSSASKLVFLLLAVTACVGFFLGKLEAKDFMLLAGMAFTFYFSNKGSETNQFLGK